MICKHCVENIFVISEFCPSLSDKISKKYMAKPLQKTDNTSTRKIGSFRLVLC